MDGAPPSLDLIHLETGKCVTSENGFFLTGATWTEAAAKPLKAKSDQDWGHVVAMTGTAAAPAAVGSV